MDFVYVVQYHNNSWGAQESLDEILGVYDSITEAYKRSEEFEDRYTSSDDIVSVRAYELNEKILSEQEELSVHRTKVKGL